MCLQAIKINSTNCNVLIAPKRISERASERNAMHDFGFACVTCELEVRKYAMLQMIVQVFRRKFIDENAQTVFKISKSKRIEEERTPQHTYTYDFN